MNKVVIAGGTGFIGNYLVKQFENAGYKVLIISRDPKHISWNPTDMTEAFESADIVINLAGKSINCRHTEENKKNIINSRINTTIWVGNAILACIHPPKLWLNASASGIYKASTDSPMTEKESVLGTDFMADVVKQWEKVFFAFRLPNTRRVVLRTSVVLGRKGGALLPLSWLSRLWLGGKQGSGNQMFSWIHIEDYFKIIQFLSENKNINGIINCTSPGPLTNKDFMSAIRKTLRIPVGINAPAFAIQLGAKLIGTEPELILNSSYVIPERLLESGYTFAFPDVYNALADLLK